MQLYRYLYLIKKDVPKSRSIFYTAQVLSNILHKKKSSPKIYLNFGIIFLNKHKKNILVTLIFNSLHETKNLCVDIFQYEPCLVPLVMR